MKTVLITGSLGLVGAEAVRQFAALGYRTLGIDNDTRGALFGESASVKGRNAGLSLSVTGYEHHDIDVADEAWGADNIWKLLLKERGAERDVAAVIHCAAQPSHDYAATDPFGDFRINASGTLNMLEATRKYFPAATFIHMSTNKVYGDWPNTLDYREGETRLHPPPLWEKGFWETLPVDQVTHSLFGCSKLAADAYVQEYGRYFGMNTVCFRGGCLTGPGHAGVEQHGFLSYLGNCAVSGKTYKVIGHGGKQVRDNLHAADLVRAFVEFVNKPQSGAVYNIGGGPERSCSVLEAIAMAESITGRKMNLEFVETPRIGDHKWWVTDNAKFERDYPEWRQRYSLEETMREIIAAQERKAAA